MAPKRSTKPATIDEYLARLDEPQRSALEQLRSTILAVSPDLTECISYQLPAFRWQGRVLLAIGAAQQHCSFYPMSSATIREFAPELTKYDTSTGTIRFQPERPLPKTLVRKLVKARMRENQD